MIIKASNNTITGPQDEVVNTKVGNNEFKF